MSVLRGSKFKKTAIILFLAILAGAVLFLLRGPYISNLLKMAILSDLQAATGREVIARKIYINILPLFVEARGIKAFDENGIRVFAAESVKGYVRVSSILKRQIEVQRVVLKKPELWADRAQLGEILENIRKYRAKKKKKFIGVKVKAVTVKTGELSFYDEKHNAIVTARGVDAEMVLREEPEVSFTLLELAMAVRDWPVVKGRITGAATLKEDTVDFQRLAITSHGSNMEGTGVYLKAGRGSFSVSLNLLVDSIKKIFGLKRTGQGSIHASGSVKVFKEIKDTALDLKVKGDFYLETLMELLRAKTEQTLDGLVSFDGRLKGKIADLTGSADARLKDGALFGIKVDDLGCSVAYKDGVLSFKDGRGKLYGGSAQAEASIMIPGVKPYSLSVSFSGMDSPSALELIKLSKLNIPYGKVKGQLQSSGNKFAPEGWVVYRAVKASDSPLGRVKEIKGDFKMRGEILTLSGFEARTDVSRTYFDGSLNLSLSSLNLDGRLMTVDVNDLLSPYFKRVRGSGESNWRLTGTFDDPFIEGGVRLSNISLDDYIVGDVAGEISYRKEILRIKTARAVKGQTAHEVEGTVEFPDALEILDLGNPRYNLTASLRRADLNGLLKVFGLDTPVEGSVDSRLNITGDGVYSGSASAYDVRAYGVSAVSAAFEFSYDYRDFVVKNAAVVKGDSSLGLDGSVSIDGDFYFKASSERLLLGDVIPESMPVNYMISLDAEGKGTFKNPDVRVAARLSDGEFKGKDIGDGILKVALKDRDVVFEAKVFDERAAVKGRAYLDGELPWSAELDIGQGRYDFLIGAFLKEVPEDLMFDIQGSAYLSGNKNHLRASANLDRMHVTLFGQGFSNYEGIEISIDDKKLYLSKVMMKSGDASLTLGGALEFNAFYDIIIEGSSSLSPLKGFLRKIDVLKGEADFVFALQGKWDNPTINGGINVSNTSFGIRGIPQSFTSINGYLYVDDNRVVVQRLGAKFGGGDVEVAGIVQIEGFDIQRVYLDTLINDVTVVSKDYIVNFGGNVLFRGTPDLRYLTGEMRINRAKYRKRLEWKSWLLKAKQPEVLKSELGWADRIGLNVRVYGAEDIIVDNNIARAPLEIDMTLRGTIGSPQLFGRIESREGKVYFRNTEFRILNATVDYADFQGSGPFIEILAATSVKGYHIWLSLEGKMQQFNLGLVSDPPLDEVEILALLAVGEFGERLKGIESGIGAAAATSFLTGKLQDVMEERLRDITGLSRVQIIPYVSKSTGTITSRVTVSKTLMGDKLFITYSTAVGTAEDEIKVEYLLVKNISLVGIRDERGSIGGDIKFRFQFK